LGLVESMGFHPEVRMTDVDYLLSIRSEDVSRLAGLIEERGMKVFTHGPFFGLDVASLDRKISDYSFHSIIRGLEVSRSLGAEVMVIHTGYLPQYSRGGRRHWFRNFRRKMTQIAEEAGRIGIKLALENTWDDRPEVILHMLEMLPDNSAWVCLDTGHMNAFSRYPVRRWWSVLGKSVIALHLHDNDGLSDDHLVPGCGTFDFQALVDEVVGSGSVPLLDFEVDFEGALQARSHIDGLFRKHGY